jgi:hypothetical protein
MASRKHREKCKFMHNPRKKMVFTFEQEAEKPSGNFTELIGKFGELKELSVCDINKNNYYTFNYGKT